VTLLPGCRFAVAPKFHLNADWAPRVTIGTGVDESDGKFFPRGPWRLPSRDELAVLVAGAEPGTTPPGALPLFNDPDPPARADALDTRLCLFQIPEHLREAWWALVEKSAESGVAADGPRGWSVKGFDAFAARLSDFLVFKGLSGPATRMEVLVTAPGARSIRVDPATGRPAGLGPTIAPWSPWPVGEPAAPRLRAVLNLGDEGARVVVINLTLSDTAAELARREPAGPTPATVGALVARFGAACPDYPPVRLRLGPGEGCRLPSAGLILDGDMTDEEEPGVTLLVSEDGPAGADPLTRA
jgi:hypothetical protein